MSFGTDLNTLMNADTSINVWCDGGVYYENLPDNFDLTKTWIGYSFRKISQTSCIDSKNAYTTYSITIKVIDSDTLHLETISDHIVNYLNHKEHGGIKDIWFVSDAHGMDLEKAIYINTLEFQSFYVD